MQLCLHVIYLILLFAGYSNTTKSTSYYQDKNLANGDDSVFTHEVEALLINEIDAEIEEVEDLKTQMAVLDRHVRKHSSSDTFASGFVQLNKIDKSNIDTLENQLKMKKREILGAKNKIDKDYVLSVNKMVEEAEVFVENNFKKVYDALDSHIESEDHKNEHNDHHGEEHGHAHDSLEDYADLLQSEPKEKIIDYIDSEIIEFKHIKEQKAKLSNHLKDHQSGDSEHDNLHLEISENVLREIDTDYMEKQQQSLTALKHQIKDTRGKLKQDDVQTVMATIEKAGEYIESSNDRLELVELVDAEYEEDDQTNSEIIDVEIGKDSKTIYHNNDVTNRRNFKDTKGHEKVESRHPTLISGQYSPKTVEALKKAAENSHKFLHEKNLAGHGDHTDDVMKVDLAEKLTQSIIFVMPVVVMVAIFIVLIVFLCASRNKSQKVECGEAAPDLATATTFKDRFAPKDKSPELLLEKEVQNRTPRRRRR